MLLSAVPEVLCVKVLVPVTIRAGPTVLDALSAAAVGATVLLKTPYGAEMKPAKGFAELSRHPTLAQFTSVVAPALPKAISDGKNRCDPAKIENEAGVHTCVVPFETYV